MIHRHIYRRIRKRPYILCHICGTAIITALFTNTSFFSPLYGQEQVDTLMLWILAVTCCVFGVMVTWRSRRNHELWLNVFAPAMIWITASQMYTVPVPIVCAAMSVPIFHFILPRSMQADDILKAKPIKTRFILFLRKSRRVGMRAIAVILLFLGIRGYWFSSTIEFPRASEREQTTIESCREELTQLEPSRWVTLGTKQKLAVLQTVANIEADMFGLPERLIVKTENLSGGTLAEYSHVRKIIRIDRKVLKEASSDEVLRCTLHECRHSYQHQIITLYECADDRQKDLMIFREADALALKDSFDNYIDGDHDYENYFHLRCEEDAREWADERSLVYFNLILSFLQQEG